MDDEDEVIEGSSVPSIFDDLPLSIQSFFRQFYCCSGLVGMPLVAGMAQTYRQSRNAAYLKFMNYEEMEKIIFGAETASIILGGIFLFFLGRKKSAILSNILHLGPLLLLSAQEISESSVSFDFYCVMLIIYGSHRFQWVIFQIYVAELTSAQNRAFFMGFFYLGHNLGRTLATPFYSSYIVLNIFNMVFAVASLVQSFMVPESPFWLALKGRQEEAVEVLMWISAGTAEEDEFEPMLERAEDAATQRSTIESMLGRIFSLRFSTCLVLVTFMLLSVRNLWASMSGLMTVDQHRRMYSIEWIARYKKYYNLQCGYLFREFLPVLGSFIFMGINFLFSRKVLFIGLIALQAPLYGTYWYKLDEQLMSWGLLCYILAYAGPMPISSIIPVEIFPAVTRELGVTISYLLDWLLYEMQVYQLYHARNVTNWVDTAIIYFQRLCVPVSLLFMLIFMPETRNLTLEEAEDSVDVVQQALFPTFEEPVD